MRLVLATVCDERNFPILGKLQEAWDIHTHTERERMTRESEQEERLRANMSSRNSMLENINDIDASLLVCYTEPMMTVRFVFDKWFCPILHKSFGIKGSLSMPYLKIHFRFLFIKVMK